MFCLMLCVVLCCDAIVLPGYCYVFVMFGSCHVLLRYVMLDAVIVIVICS